MTLFSEAWTNIPDGTALSRPGRHVITTGISGSALTGEQRQHEVRFEVTADGSVVMETPGWLPVTSDGRITGFEPVPDA